jgi:pyruvate dehydrogenase kinase 2/3/4
MTSLLTLTNVLSIDRAVELDDIPLFRKSENIKNVCSWYKTSFKQLRECPAPINKEKEQYFARAIESIFDRHSATLITMAKGAHELRLLLGQDIATFSERRDIQKRLDDFYMSRIGIRTLIGQYLALRKPSDDADMVGLISKKASPYNIALSAINDAAYMCSRQHGDAPEVQILGRTDLTFPYVPSHISYILLELLKNSMRATVETHGTDKMPPIRIVIADGEDNEDVVIKISDEGGGIPRSNMNRIWSYLFTTANPQVLERMLMSSDVRDFDTASPLAGLGYGLPISRNYARYFGGDLIIMSMEGYGTDSFIYLPRLGERSAVV